MNTVIASVFNSAFRYPSELTTSRCVSISELKSKASLASVANSDVDSWASECSSCFISMTNAFDVK
jgi:hypothetical protein